MREKEIEDTLLQKEGVTKIRKNKQLIGLVESKFIFKFKLKEDSS